MQTPILCSLLTLIHASDAEFSALVLSKLQGRLLLAFEEDEVAVSKLLLRAFACLASSGCLSLQSLRAILSPLLDELVAVGDAVQEQHEVAAYLLASTLMWAVDIFHQDGEGSQFLSLAVKELRRIHDLRHSPFAIRGRQAIFQNFTPFDEENKPLYQLAGVGDDDESGAFDSLQEVTVAVLQLVELVNAGSDSALTCLPKPWFQSTASEPLRCPQDFLDAYQNVIEEDTLGRRARTCAVQGAILPTIGAAATAGRAHSWLRGKVHIFSADTSADAATCAQSVSVLQKVCAAQYFQDVMMFFDPIINEDGTKLGNVDLMINHLLAVFKLFPADSHLEYLLVETLFQCLLQQPASSAQNALVHRIILNLCKQHSAFPPVVALASNVLFQMVPDLDWGAAKEFGRWFAFHYINTNLSWPYWDFWVSLCTVVAEGEDEQMAAARCSVTFFCQYVVKQIARMISTEKAAQTQYIPAIFQEHVHTDYSAHCGLFQSEFSCSLSVVPGAEAWASKLRELVQDKASDDDVLDWFEKHAGQIPEADYGSLFVHAALAVNEGHTLTAIVGMLERYDQAIRLLCESPSQQHNTLTALVEIYGHSPYMLSFVFEEMLRRGQLSVVDMAKHLIAALPGNGLGTRTDIHSWMEATMDRALDFVRASVSIYQHHFQSNNDNGRTKLITNETAVLTPSAQPLASAASSSMVTTESEMEGADPAMAVDGGPAGEVEVVDYDMDDENAAEKRAKRQHDRTVPAQREPEQDHLHDAEEAAKAAIVHARTVFHTFLVAFVDVLGNNNSSDPSVEVSKIVALAELNRMFRVFFGAERQLTHQLGQDVVLTNRLKSESAVHVLEGGVLVAASVEYVRLVGALQDMEPALHSAWRGFF